MDWILANKEWVFSGVGVAIVGSFIALFFRRRTAGSTHNVSTVKARSMIGSPVATGSNISQNVSITLATPQSAQFVEYSPRPAPREIFSQLSSLPVFQQADAAEAYKGIKVRWSAEFWTMEDIRLCFGYEPIGDTTHFVLLNAEKRSELIRVPVNIERIPRLKVTHRGTKMEVRGTIQEVKASILLKDATLSFVD